MARMGFAEMIMSPLRDDDDDDTPKILPEAAIMRMREAAARYSEQLTGPRFEPGDLVVPIKGTNLRGTGSPHLVLETRYADPNFSVGNEGSCALGMRMDMRVMSIPDGDACVAHWVESYAFERFTES